VSALLEAENVRVEFGSLVAVRDVSFQLEGGQLVGLIGPNGSGKTTLLRVLAGLHSPTHGRALVLGKPVLGEHEVVRHLIGFAPDSPPAYEELTIYQFLRFITAAYGMSRDEAEERIDFWLEQLWLSEKRAVPVKHLSKGMRQRVTLARTFLPRPHVILLDEPLVGLDPAGRVQLRGVLNLLRMQGCAMVVSSHILSDLEEVATHIAILELGRIIRWTGTDRIHHQDHERRTYRMVCLHALDGLGDRIASIEGISDVRMEGRTFTFDYHAEDEAATALLQRLVTMDVPILSFAAVKTSLEEVYLRSGVKQVD